jgi:hypothetical protein
MDAKTILKILASHDVGAKECASFAAKSGDLGTAVNAALSMGHHKDTVRSWLLLCVYVGDDSTFLFLTLEFAEWSTVGTADFERLPI